MQRMETDRYHYTGTGIARYKCRYKHMLSFVAGTLGEHTWIRLPCQKRSKNYKLCSFVLEMSLIHPDVATYRSEAGD